MSEAQELLKIGEFARLAGTNLRTLRYYEELELLLPTQRSKGGFRYYRHADLKRLVAIRTLQDLGLQLERIRDILRVPAERTDRTAFIQRVREALQEEDRLLRESVDRLQGQRGKVAEALGKLDECRPCPHTPNADNNYCEPCLHTGATLPDLLSALF